MRVNTVLRWEIRTSIWMRSEVANVADHARLLAPTLRLVLSEEERKDRLAYWIGDTIRRRRLSPPKVAAQIGVSRSTVAAWAGGRQVPSLIYLGPLADALGVDPRLFADLPEIPPSGAAQYLVVAAESGVEEGLRRGRSGPATPAPGTRAPSRGRSPRGSGAKS